MVYEKKMLILSGEGSGVVMIEKSARGVRFALRTLGLARSDNARVGIITRKAVYVRDLPAESDPSAVFYIDDAETNGLHFAVFDARLRLYGTTATTRMWEANVMDLLNKYGAPVVLPERALPTLPTLPPVSAPPKVLPAPDGTGIPQSRLDIYGDDALAENDIYTSLDFSARMREVDEFLDSPRVLDLAAGTPYSGELADAAPQQYAHAETTAAKPYASALDGLSPHIMPPPDVPAYMLFPPDRDLSTTTTATTDAAAPEPRAPREAYASGRADSASAEAASVSEAKTDAATNAAATGAGYDDGGSSADAREARREQAVTELSAAQKYDTVKAATASDTETASFIFNPVPPAADDAERGAEYVEHVEANAENGAAHVDGATDATAKRAESDAEILSNAANSEANTDMPSSEAGGETNTASAVNAETDMRLSATNIDADGDGAAGMPWERTAKWLKARSERNPVVKRERVHTVEQKTNVATLREVAFFERCRADIEKLFSSAPKDEELTALLPDIEWVRVEFGGHAVGVGRSDNAFLCYAVAGQYEKASPLGDEAQWLPKLKNSPTGRGYWLIFQDLISGDILGN